MGLKKKHSASGKPNDTAGALKKKSRIYSTEAAAISIGVHLLLIILAGSWVAVRYVQKQKAELTVYNPPPKMERRQISAPAEKLERIRQTAQRPKIVSSRAAASASEFSLPAVSGVGKVSTQKFSSPFSGIGRDFSLLTKGVSFRIPNFKFLGVRASGEKLAFLIESTPEMLADSTGGETACAYIKEELTTLLSEIPSSVIFNVFLYNGKTVTAFQPQMMPVTDENLVALREWITPALNRLSPDGLTPEQNTYVPEKEYDTAVGAEASSWARAMQAALEQRPDSVFVVGRDWGRHELSPDKGRILFNFSLWEFLGGGGKNSIAQSPALLEDREMRDSFIVDAVESITDEEKQLRRERAPAGFVRNLIDYVQYSEDQIIDHINTVCRDNYSPAQQAPPQINYIRLVSKQDVGVPDASSNKIRHLVGVYNGDYKFLNGNTVSIKTDPEAEEESASVETEGAVESIFKFFGKNKKSSRVAFVLDVSDAMFDEKTGGQKSFDWIKDKVALSVKSLNPETLFNVFACRGQQVVAFAPEPVSGVSAEELDAWLAAVQRGLEMPGLPVEKVVTAPVHLYKTAIGSEIQGVPLALQVAMEQRADTLLVAGSGVGRIQASHDKARRLLDFSILHAMGSAGDDQEEETLDLMKSSSTGMLAPLEEDQEQWRMIMLQAFDLLEADNEWREDTFLPLGFVRDLFKYIQYTPDHIVGHLQTVARAAYPEHNGRVELPEIDFVKLVDQESKTKRAELDEFREFSKVFGGQVQLVTAMSPRESARSAGRSGSKLSALPKRRQLGLPKFKLLDTRASGEKVVVILDASRAMLSDRTGGAVTCDYIKQDLVEMLSTLPPTVSFNVVLHDGKTVAEFRPELVTATPEQMDQFKEWLVPVLNPDFPGLSPEQNTYVPPVRYDTALDSGASCWARAMQVALEQHADTVFVLGCDWGRHDISPEKSHRLIDFSLWEILSGNDQSFFAQTPVLYEDREMRDICIVDTVDLIGRLGPDRDPFVPNLPDYMQYSGEQIIDHLNTVCLQNYMPVEQGPPQVNWIRLVSTDDVGRSDVTARKISDLMREYDGTFEELDGQKIYEKYAEETEEELVEIVDDSEESRFEFFGTDVESKSIAFVLDVSEAMFDEETGGDAPFEYIKGQIAGMIRELDPKTKFNLIAANEERIVAFAPQMGCGFDPDEVDTWLAAVQRGLEMSDLPAEKAGDVSVSYYKTLIGEDVKGLPLALQTAMEQQADTILVAEADMGRLPVDQEKARRLLDLAILKKLGPRGASSDSGNDDDDDDDEDDLDASTGGDMVAPLRADLALMGQLIKQAITLMEEENVWREDEGLPLGFVRDIFDYIEYSPQHIFRHLASVSSSVYPTEGDEVLFPQIHFAKLISEEDPVDRKEGRVYSSYEEAYASEVRIIIGASSEEEMEKLNRSPELLSVPSGRER